MMDCVCSHVPLPPSYWKMYTPPASALPPWYPPVLPMAPMQAMLASLDKDTKVPKLSFATPSLDVTSCSCDQLFVA
jgi:hypothetical protein